MRAVCWEGKKNIQVLSVPDPSIINPRDAIVKITTTAICGAIGDASRVGGNRVRHRETN